MLFLGDAKGLHLKGRGITFRITSIDDLTGGSSLPVRGALFCHVTGVFGRRAEAEAAALSRGAGMVRVCFVLRDGFAALAQAIRIVLSHLIKYAHT